MSHLKHHHRRSHTRARVMLAVAIAVGSLALAHSPARAQSQTVRPPKPGQTDAPPTIRTWLLVVLLVAGSIGAANIPSKRGHQD